ncbi:MAG: ABC transporter substrate-binding protein, partial [Verrucomicrobia bacterium 21-51-4]
PSVVEGLAKVDPAHKTDYERAAADLKTRYLELDAWIRKRVAEIAPKNRILVTSHDAFNYFGRDYGFQVIGVQGISTVTEAGLADMSHTEDMIKQKHVKAIFVESSVPHKTIERISHDTGAKIGGELFSDALGKPGEMETGPDGERYDLGTWEGMLKHNVNAIVEALR